MNKITTLLSSMAIILMICSAIIKPKNTEPYEKFALPGVIKINDNFYCDQTEISNFHWLEYLFWKEKAFGTTSIEYKNALPDTNVWLKEDSCLHSYTQHYLRHPAYRDYPVVGITKKQAEDYSKWRSDRVFEYFLIKNEVFDWIGYDSTNYFTIERYFRGEYRKMQPDKRFQYYPVYRLPSSEEQLHILNYNNWADSLMFSSGCKTKKCANCRESITNMQIAITPCPNDSSTIDPTTPIIPYTCIKTKENTLFPQLYHIYGNVAELASDDQIWVKNNWKNDFQTLKTEFKPSIPASTVGFRCVATWKKWE